MFDLDAIDSDEGSGDVDEDQRHLHHRSPSLDLASQDPLCNPPTAGSSRSKNSNSTAALDIDYFFIHGDEKLGTKTYCKICK
jgi:hypothetical protein